MKDKQKSNHSGVGLASGAGIRAAIGAVTWNIGLGFSVGMSVGLAFASGFQMSQNKDLFK